MPEMDVETTARVYQYGTVPERIAPVLGTDAAAFQIRLANRLWNTLVAIERTRTERYRKIMSDEGQEAIEGLRGKLAAMRAEVKGRRKELRRRKVDTADLDAVIADTRAELRALIDARKATSEERHEAARADLNALAERTKHRIKRARQASANMGLFWGSYNDIVGRADTGRKLGDLQFRRYTGDGTLTAQIMGGAAIDRCVGGEHTFFQIAQPVAGRRWRYARMRIGSNADRSPVWLEIPIVYHRDIPPASTIKSVSMSRHRGRWSLNVTVTLAAAPVRAIGPAIAIDIGYRLKPEGVRVAYWADSDGAHGEVLVPTADIAQFEQVRSLRSTCDRMRDEFLPALVEWLKGRALDAEWTAQSAAIALWRSTDRLARLIRWWSDHRIDGDGEMYASASKWRGEYLHLANWWRCVEDQMRFRLREQYRMFAAGAARRYRTLYLEEFDLRSVAELPKPESKEIRTASAGYRQMVSPSVFRMAVMGACTREGVTAIKLPAEYTTRVCHVCNYAGAWDQAVSIAHRCVQCGEVWDQDQNAAINLLRLGLASGESVPTGNQPVRERKWDRVRNRSQRPPEEVGRAAVAV